MSEQYAQTPSSPLTTPVKMTDYKFGRTTPPSVPRQQRVVKQVYTPEHGWMASYEWPVGLDPHSQEGANALVAIGHTHLNYCDSGHDNEEYEYGYTQPPIQRQLWSAPPPLDEPALEQYSIYGVLDEMDTNSQPGITTTQIPYLPAPPVVLFHGPQTHPLSHHSVPPVPEVVTPTRFLRDLRCDEIMEPQPPPSPYRLPVIPPIDPPMQKDRITTTSPTKLSTLVTKHPLSSTAIVERKPASTTVVFARLANIFILDFFNKIGDNEYIPEWKLKKAFHAFLEKAILENDIYCLFLKPKRIEKLNLNHVYSFASRKSNCTFQFTLETFVSLGLLHCKVTETARTKKLEVESFCKTPKLNDFKHLV